MSTVQEIRLAIAALPTEDRLGLIDWIHSQEEAADVVDDPELLKQAEQGARELDTGQGISLEQARKLTSTWISNRNAFSSNGAIQQEPRATP